MRISDSNEIGIFLRMHPLANNQRLFVETQAIVPTWLQGDMRQALLNLVNHDTGRIYYTLNGSNVAHLKEVIQVGKFTVFNKATQYNYEFVCPNVHVFFEQPMPKLDESVFLSQAFDIDGLLPPENDATVVADNELCEWDNLVYISNNSPLLFASTTKPSSSSAFAMPQPKYRQ